MPLVLELVQEGLTNTQDVGGLWQVEGGRILEAGERVGDFSSVRRVSCGTEEQNTAMVWMTVFFLEERPPQNITHARFAQLQQRRGDRQRERGVRGLRDADSQAVPAGPEQRQAQHTDDRLKRAMIG